jgi:hypothetical protein
MTASRPPLTCARCGRDLTGKAAHHWPEGHICTTCHTWALETYGVCAGCGVDRMTPGIAADGGRLCTSCAGMPGRSFFCLRCGAEGRRHRQGVCARCVLTDHLDQLLDDGSGRVRAERADELGQAKRWKANIPPTVVVSSFSCSDWKPTPWRLSRAGWKVTHSDKTWRGERDYRSLDYRSLPVARPSKARRSAASKSPTTTCSPPPYACATTGSSPCARSPPGWSSGPARSNETFGPQFGDPDGHSDIMISRTVSGGARWSTSSFAT